MIRKLIKIFLLMFILLNIISCNNASNIMDDDSEIIELKVAYFNEVQFEQRFGTLIDQLLPDLRVEVVSILPLINGADAELWISTEQPDVIYLPMDLHRKFVENGYLELMDDLIKNKINEPDDLVPAMLEEARMLGEGRIYGLSPDFYNSVIVYNKDLFDQQQITYLTDQISWFDLFDKLMDFPLQRNDTQLYGLNIPDYRKADLLYLMGLTEGLNLLSSDGKQSNLDSPLWGEIWGVLIQALQAGAVGTDQTMDDFLQERSIMMLVTAGELHRLMRESVAFEWGIIPAPISYSSSGNVLFRLNGLFGISLRSDRSETAWKLIEFLHEKRIMDWEQGALNHTGFPARKSSLEATFSRSDNIESLYKHSPDPYSLEDSVPAPVLQLIEARIEQALAEREGAAQALANLHGEIEELLFSLP